MTDKEEILKVLENCFEAISVRDSKRIVAHYASDVIVFDVKPPFQTRGAVAWRHTWEASLPFFPDSFKIETREMHIHVGTDMAFAHFMMRLITPEVGHDAAQTWVRCTSCLKRQQSKWKIIHEHGSIPYNPLTLKANLTLDVDQ